jgi:hypothetical protein
MRIDKFSKDGHIYISEELNERRPREEWALVIDAIHDWYLDRTIQTKAVCAPWRLDYGGEGFQDLGSHTTLRLAASIWNWRDKDKVYIELNPDYDNYPSATMMLGSGSLATQVKRLYVNARPDDLTLYAYSDRDRGHDDFQVFKFASR